MSDVNYNDGKWHGWNGGECPVHPESVVKFFTHQQRTGVGSAKYLTWSMTNNIVAFRVIKEHKEPREFWISGNSTAFWDNKQDAERDAKLYGLKLIHVREVEA